MIDREKVIKELVEHIESALDVDSDYVDCVRTDLLQYTVALLKDRTKDYEAWAKEIGADTCVNCRHASFNRNDGKSTCPIEHNFALVKDGFCHLFMRMEGR